MSKTITISSEVARHLDRLDFGKAGDIEEKIQQLLVAEYHRRLARYRLTNQQFGRKYGMTFEEFEQQEVTKQKGYSWDVEADAIAWETAVDGIQTVQQQLLALLEHPDDD